MNDLKSGILVVDFGSQTTLLIARRLRELGVYSEVWSCADARLQQPPLCLGVVLSGGPASVSAGHAPTLPEALLAADIPILGICYGMQLLTERFGGRVEPGKATTSGVCPTCSPSSCSSPCTRSSRMRFGSSAER